MVRALVCLCRVRLSVVLIVLDLCSAVATALFCIGVRFKIICRCFDVSARGASCVLCHIGLLCAHCM